MHAIDVILPTYNNCEGLKACIRSLQNQTFKDFYVWICVDGSTDGTIAFLEAFCVSNTQFSFLQHSDRQNHGRAQNRNQALPYLKAPYTLFLDGDAIADPELLYQHYQTLQKNSGCISLGYTHWANQADNLWAAYISTRGVAKHQSADRVPYQYFTTQNTALKTSYFTELGGFDPHFVLYGGEDTEFAYRIHKLYKASFVFCKDAQIHTTADKSLDQALQLLETFGRHNLKYIAQKHPECGEIFYLNLLKGKSLKAILFRAFLNPLTYVLALTAAKSLPKNIAILWVNICVASRIKKGFGNLYV